jgi:hypothetical protein
VLAAGELVHLLEEDAGPDEAISEAERQIARWQTPPLSSSGQSRMKPWRPTSA